MASAQSEAAEAMTEGWSPIKAKLDRTKEHIQEIETEYKIFMNQAPDISGSDNDPKTVKAFHDFFRNAKVSPRLSIMCGEAVAQLRSCFDHIIHALHVRALGDPEIRVQFPVCRKDPNKGGDRNDPARYGGQVGKIRDLGVLTLIERLQPYRAKEPNRTLLSVLSDFNNTDKHRALILHMVNVLPMVEVTSTVGGATIETTVADDGTYPTSRFDADGDFVTVVNVKKYLAPFIAFDEFGKSGIKQTEVVWGLSLLQEQTHEAVLDFQKYLL